MIDSNMNDSNTNDSNITTVTSTSNVYTITGNLANYSFANTNVGSSNISSAFEVHGDAKFNGDIKWKGRSLDTMLETIENRLAILIPDPEKLSQFEALQKAYDHYKLMEKLCQLPGKDK